jgi:hypothetical protein
MTEEIFQIETLAEHCLRVIKRYREALLIDCIVMIDESSVRLLLRINAVRPGRELVCMPRKVDVQGRGERTSGIFSDEREELFVSVNRAFEYCLGEWALDPTSAMHFLSKFELTLDSGDQVEFERQRPVGIFDVVWNLPSLQAFEQIGMERQTSHSRFITDREYEGPIVFVHALMLKAPVSHQFSKTSP